MGLGALLLVLIFIGGTLGFIIDTLVWELIYKIKDKISEKKQKKRREFKPGVLGKYEP